MGINHAMSGCIAGVGLAALFGDVPLPVRLLGVAVTGGAALLNDLDHPSSTVAHSLGPVTKWLARGLNELSLSVYHATRADADNPNRENGHRTLTHTILGALLFGLIAAGVTGGSRELALTVHLPAWAGPLPGALTLALLTGLLVDGLPAWVIRFLASVVHGSRHGVGAGLVVAGGVTAWGVMSSYPTYWWFWGVTVAVGSLTHSVGDTFTNTGDPLLWPLTIRGQRWYKVRTPATFNTGQITEKKIVTPFIGVGFVVAVGFATGTLPVLIGAVSAVIRG